MSKTPEIASPQKIELESVLGMFFLKDNTRAAAPFCAEELQFFVIFFETAWNVSMKG